MSQAQLELAQSARSILQRGWTQPGGPEESVDARDEKGAPCSPLSPVARSWTLVGALMLASGSTDQTLDAGAVYAALRQRLPNTGLSPSHWANAPGRTKTEVLRLLEDVIRDGRFPSWRAM